MGDVETLLAAMTFENEALQMNLEEYDMPTSRCERQRENLIALRAAVEAVKVEAYPEEIDIEDVHEETENGWQDCGKRNVIIFNVHKEKAEAIKALLTGKPPGESA